jgi:hypothetical protein
MRHILAKLLIICIVVTFGMVVAPPPPQPANAQFAWNVTLWVATGSGSYLETVNPLGSVVTLPLSPSLTPPIEFNSRAVMTSDNDQYILHLGFDSNTNKPHLMFGATTDGACCTDVSDLLPDVMAYELAGFEPNGSRFAVSYVRSTSGTNNPFIGGILIVDAETQSLLFDMSIESAMDAIGAPQTAAWAFLGDWTEAGIEFSGNCYGCEGVFEGQFSLWDPNTGAFVAESGTWFNAFGRALDQTGELLLAEQDTNFDYDPSPGMFAVPNVITYYPSGDYSGVGTVVYVDSETLNIGPLHWVADGHAFLVESPQEDHWDVVQRDGTLRQVSFAPEYEPQILGGTPDGWLAVFSNEDGTRILYHYDLTTLEASTITTFPANAISIQLANAPRLGDSIGTQTFAGVSAPDSGPTARCPNFLPSRLVVGGQARVTPGASNRMREFPTLDSAIVGQIPAGSQFSVLEGPICDELNQIAWWRVNFNGTQGWTAEGQGNTYWTEPIG